MAGERVEVAAERLYVHGHMRDCLRAVDHYRYAARLREPDDLGDRD